MAHKRRHASIVLGFAAFDVVMAALQASTDMPWHRWVSFAMLVVMLALSLLEYRGRPGVAGPLAASATLLACLGVPDFVAGRGRAVDHVALAALWLTAAVAWWLLVRRRTR